ncbi:CDP-glycerol glycerophosphotransferase family protein [Kangiella sp. TOML190]|uniref:CDP-glycerol glycerophosphotransferase family protein n=1 Tax=Kangiella sp. TOML190 TaxID=2931351 RepID=UPI002040846D|nr:CDP-glycerol glycerophosphotransferase family protein [Kangiella sp. TOML190]
MQVIFDTQNIYYIPQYYPIYKVLIENNIECIFVCYTGKNDQSVFAKEIPGNQVWVSGKEQALDYYLKTKPDWIFFGNAFQGLEQIHQYSKTAQLGHGVGPKPSYYRKSDTPMTVRFMEGELRLRIIKQMYPEDTFVQVGFSKLDPIFDGSEQGIDLVAKQLDTSKKTLLYAPTFNPSSLERFPDNWPEKFSDYNVLIKPHAFTYTRKQYKGQRKKLKKWASYANCYVAPVEDYSLLPYLKTADLLISEASSTLFEFVVLDKPVIVANFFKLKWSYRGPFSYRFEKRFGKDNVIYNKIGTHISKFSQLKNAVKQQLANPQEYREQRAQYRQDHIGPVDGKASQRIVDYLLERR